MPDRSTSTRQSAILVVLGVVLIVAAAGGGGYLIWGGGLTHASEAPATTAAGSSAKATRAPANGGVKPTAPPSPSAPAEPEIPATYPKDGPGTFSYAGGQSSVFGTAGGLRRYRVAVENTVPVKPADFAANVDVTLSDPRSWIGGGNVRLQRVGAAEPADFTVFLATGGTTGRLCQAGGVNVTVNGEPYTSCRAGARVVINLERYFHAVPEYTAPLAVYRQYAINHEVGHALGHGHELCPKAGSPAPVMQQQTLYMQGCTPNQWPYLNGKRYAGPAGKL